MKRTTAKVNFRGKAQLVPVVVQSADSGQVLMLAFANPNALRATIRTGWAHYYSRSRRTLWKKGETSGNVQRVRRILVDCDGDAVVYEVRQKGVACHTGNLSCFHRELFRFVSWSENKALRNPPITV